MPGISENIVSDHVLVEAGKPVRASLWQRGLRAMMRVFLPMLSKLPAMHVRGLMYEWVLNVFQDLQAEDAARFLMGLDNDLYPLHGQAAINYDSGVHSKHRLTNYHDFFVARIEPNQQVLDIGCGMGAVAYDVAAKSEAKVLGLDLDEDSIKAGQQRYQHPNLSLQFGDALALETEQPFDVVILSNVLEHLPNRVNFLTKVKQHTRAKKFLIRVPLFERDWRVPFKQELAIEWRLDHTHETEYTLESFQEEADMAGLKIAHLEVRWGEIWSELVPDGA